MVDYMFDHIHLNSTDIVNTTKFYENLGAEQTGVGKMPDGRATVHLNLKGIVLRISEQASIDNVSDGLSISAGNYIDHFGIRTNDFDKAIDELESMGVEFKTQVSPVRSGRMIFFQAPQNVLIELIGK